MKSKPSMESDTNTVRDNVTDNRSEKRGDIDSLLDLYWGGQERRISGLTVQIIALNGIALVMLLVGLLYFAQYHGALIDAKMRRVEAESELIIAALSSEAMNKFSAEAAGGVGKLDTVRMRDMVARLSQITPQRIRVYDMAGHLVVDSHAVNPRSIDNNRKIEHIESIQILTDMAKFVLRILPRERPLPPYSEIHGVPDINSAINGQMSGSAWKTQDGSIFISLATPLYQDTKIVGGVLLTHTAYDITYDAESVWLKIVTVFLLVFFLMVLLSIYFSGVVANPLKKLAYAAELVRKGQGGYRDIPDLRDRNDEIGDLSVSLRQMTKSLSQRMNSIESFVADVAHELKNPLTSLRSAAETLDIVRTKKDSERLMAVIQHDVRRMDRLISDIAKASRLDAALLRETAHAVDVAHVLRNILESHKPPLSRKDIGKNVAKNASGGARGMAAGQPSRNSVEIDGVRVVVHGLDTPDSPRVWGVENRMEQVFQNILQNAVSFSPQGGQVEIRIQMPNAHENFVQIIVQDEGTGIPESNLEKIFDRFYTERPQGEGYGEHSGLGLAICRQIVETFGGRIYAQNVHGKTKNKPVHGTRFIVELRKASSIS